VTKNKFKQLNLGAQNLLRLESFDLKKS